MSNKFANILLQSTRRVDPLVKDILNKNLFAIKLCKQAAFDDFDWDIPGMPLDSSSSVKWKPLDFQEPKQKFDPEKSFELSFRTQPSEPSTRPLSEPLQQFYETLQDLQSPAAQVFNYKVDTYRRALRRLPSNITERDLTQLSRNYPDPDLLDALAWLRNARVGASDVSGAEAQKHLRKLFDVGLINYATNGFTLDFRNVRHRPIIAQRFTDVLNKALGDNQLDLDDFKYVYNNFSKNLNLNPAKASTAKLFASTFAESDKWSRLGLIIGLPLFLVGLLRQSSGNNDPLSMLLTILGGAGSLYGGWNILKRFFTQAQQPTETDLTKLIEEYGFKPTPKEPTVSIQAERPAPISASETQTQQTQTQQSQAQQTTQQPVQQSTSQPATQIGRTAQQPQFVPKVEPPPEAPLVAGEPTIDEWGNPEAPEVFFEGYDLQQLGIEQPRNATPLGTVPQSQPQFQPQSQASPQPQPGSELGSVPLSEPKPATPQRRTDLLPADSSLKTLPATTVLEDLLKYANMPADEFAREAPELQRKLEYIRDVLMPQKPKGADLKGLMIRNALLSGKEGLPAFIQKLREGNYNEAQQMLQKFVGVYNSYLGKELQKYVEGKLLNEVFSSE